MTIDEKLEKLIKEGEEVKARNLKPGSTRGREYIVGEEFETWIAKCIILLQSDCTKFNSVLTDRFIKASERAVGNGTSYFDTMMGILKAFKETI